MTCNDPHGQSSFQANPKISNSCSQQGVKPMSRLETRMMTKKRGLGLIAGLELTKGDQLPAMDLPRWYRVGVRQCCFPHLGTAFSAPCLPPLQFSLSATS